MPEKVLIVEDDPRNMKVAVMALRSHGYIILQAEDGEEALKIAEKEQPNIILMDIRLPGIDGLEVTRRLKKNPSLSSIPIVAVTAHAMKGDEEQALASGCEAYVTKPIDTRQLPELVAGIMAGGGRR